MDTSFEKNFNLVENKSEAMTMENPTILRKQQELEFLQQAQQQGFALIETDFIETLTWTQLSPDDLKQMTERSMWQSDDHVYALRNDFTDQLMRYYSIYQREHSMLAYSGPIARHQNVALQLGLECYDPTIQTVQHAYQFFKSYIETTLQESLDFAVIGHFELIELLLGTQAKDPALLELLGQRNISALKAQLGVSHPLIQLLSTPTDAQLAQLHTLFPQDHKILQSLSRWETFLHQQGVAHIHLDITPQPPRSYYKGTFIKIYLSSGKVLSGGDYKGTLEGFGLGLTLNTKEATE